MFERSPRTVHDNSPVDHTQVLLSGFDVTVYCVTALEPESMGTLQVTLARPAPLVATTFNGGDGAMPIPAGTNNNKLGDPVPVPDNLFVLTEDKINC